MTTYYMQDKHDHYRYTRISKPRAYWGVADLRSGMAGLLA